jgi:hypothetical protein
MVMDLPVVEVESASQPVSGGVNGCSHHCASEGAGGGKAPCRLPACQASIEGQRVEDERASPC